MTPTPTPSMRLPAAERRQALVAAALRVFSTGSYSGATTADIAREAGVSEPILYRHFASKRELYFACLEEAWARLKAAFDARRAELGPELGPLAIAQTGIGLRSLRTLLPTLWVQALTEAGEDRQIRQFLRGHVREVHDYIADVVREAQQAGSVPGDRDADAEAWIFLAGGLLVTVADRLGGLLKHEDFAAVARSRYCWVFGREPEGPLLDGGPR